MLGKIEQEILDLENSTKRSKSTFLAFRCPFNIYKLIYYYMKENSIDRSEAIRDLILYGFSYYSGLKEKDE